MMANTVSPYVGPVPKIDSSLHQPVPVPAKAEINVSTKPDLITTVNIPSISGQGEATRIAESVALKPIADGRAKKEADKATGDKVKAAGTNKGESKKLPFADIPPHPEPVDPTALFDEIADIIRRFVVLDEEQVHAATLWVVHTHLVNDADVSPIAVINAPEKACGKTMFQDLLGRMVYRALPAANASLSAMFRAVEAWQPTILIDEADTFFRDNSELHGLINAGYKRGGFVLRSESTGDSFEPRAFSAYGAKSIAGIALEKHLPDSTMSRSIVFNLRRKLPHESVQRMRQADAGMFEQVTAKLARFASDNSQRIRQARPQLPDELSDRAQDNWEPLLAIAECAGNEWLQRATAAALKLSSASEAAASTGNELLADIQQVFEESKGTKISTAELIAALVDDDERSWATYNRGKPLTPRQLAKKLAEYGIKSKTIRLGHANTPKGYELSQFEDVFKRYLTGSPNLPQQRNVSPEPSSGMEVPVADENPIVGHVAGGDSTAPALEDLF